MAHMQGSRAFGEACSQEAGQHAAEQQTVLSPRSAASSMERKSGRRWMWPASLPAKAPVSAVLKSSASKSPTVEGAALPPKPAPCLPAFQRLTMSSDMVKLQKLQMMWGGNRAYIRARRPLRT